MNTINSSDEGVVTSDMLVATQHDDNLYGALPEKNDPITQILARHWITDPAQFLEEHYMRQRKEFDKKMGDRFAALKHL